MDTAFGGHLQRSRSLTAKRYIVANDLNQLGPVFAALQSARKHPHPSTYVQNSTAHRNKPGGGHRYRQQDLPPEPY